MKEASRFGIMNTDDEGRIVEFEEKPAESKEQSGIHGYLHIQLEASYERCSLADMKNRGFQP